MDLPVPAFLSDNLSLITWMERIVEETDNSEEAHIVGYKIFFTVWVCLVILTALTIFVSGLELGNFSTFIAMFIATLKASLVLFFFMHLRYEPPLFRVMALVAIATLTVIVLLTFSDIWFR